MRDPNCPLCLQANSAVLWQNTQLRVVDAADPNFPGFTRVIWHEHVTEMTQLGPAQRQQLMQIVWVVEQTLRDQLQPHKINVAQLGNQVPHLHWHVIPRWLNDSHYPDAIWAPPRPRASEEQRTWEAERAKKANRVPAYHAALRHALQPK